MTNKEVVKIPKLVLTGFKFKHHGAHAGYDQLQKHIPGAVWVNRDDYDYTVQEWWKKKGWARINLYLERWRDWRYQLRLKQALRGADVVHFLYPENTLACLPYNIDPAVKVIATFHQPVAWWEEVLSKPRFTQELARYQRVDTAVVLSNDLKEVIQKGLGIKDVRFVPHGVDGDFFKPNQQKRHEQVVLVLGSWMRDLDLLEAVIEHSIKASSQIAFRLVISPYHHSRFDRFDRVQCMSGLDDRDLLAELHLASLLFLPLKSATANNALLEAGATGLPIMTNKLKAIEEYFPEEEVIFFDYESLQDASKVSQRLCSVLNDPNLLAKMGASIVKRAQMYHWQNVAQKTAQLYTLRQNR